MAAVISVGELLGHVKKLPRGRWLFRGVADKDYELIPTVGRTRYRTKARKVTKQEEKRLLWRFRDQVRPHVALNLTNELEWLALAQHHGLPTRLLDWTLSPLVAAFFAAETIETRYFVDTKKKKLAATSIDGVIYAIPLPPRVSPRDREHPFNVTKTKLLEPPHVSPRIPRQSGMLTLHDDPTKAWQPSGMRRFIIPMAAKFDIKLDLDRLGLNRASLFPGIDSIAEYLKWQLKWDLVNETYIRK